MEQTKSERPSKKFLVILVIAFIAWQLMDYINSFEDQDHSWSSEQSPHSQTHQQDNHSDYKDKFKPWKKSQDSEQTATTVNVDIPTPEQQQVLKTKLNAQKEKIDIMIAELNDRIINKQDQTEIQAQIDQALAEYNQLMLPLALKQMSQP